ncbi:MAG: PQQ-binding-like beta-propeller repeat protein, partial [Terriglobales bacterium]
PAARPGAAAPAPRRIFLATEDARLIALDAANGRPEAGFGDRGQVRLSDGVGVERTGEYHMTSAPTVVGDVVVVGSAINDNDRAAMPSGVVRGYDAQSGRLLWKWDPVPHGAGDHTGAANAWAPMTADAGMGLVFVPTGSASPDYFGGLRPGAGHYADSVVALRAGTGKVAWSFQLVHHNLWDYDTSVQPTLLTVHRHGRAIPAILAANKTGFLFFLDRATGRPLDAVEERPVPKSDVAGEVSSPTQPYPPAGLRLASIGPLRPDQLWGSVADRTWCRQAIAGLRNQGIFTPPSLRGSLIIPGNIGGMAWGGAAVDPRTGLLYLNVNNLPAVIRLIPRAQFAAARRAHPGPEYAAQSGTPYGLSREFLLTAQQVPCNRPPWGRLVAVDYNAGKIAWSTPLGSWAGQSGGINLAGPLATGGGLVFEGSTLDRYLRAFDAHTGRLLWQTELPFSSPATPMTYLGADGRQYLVIAAGGHPKMPGATGDALVAFALK